MSSINDQIFNILHAVQRPGDFYATGTHEVFSPQLEVDGVGRIALPLLPVQAEQLVAIAEAAPYGLGTDTLVDARVRRTWQIDANRVKLGGKHWQESINDIVSRVATGLGVAGGIRAELYKLLVYDAGSFFISHRDTEKTAGMFATLVIVLPSAYSGGELIIKHHQQQVKLDLRCDDSCEIAFAAFYADCVHEVLPVTQGCRLTLVYNLCRTDQKLPLPQPPDYQREQDIVASLLSEWTNELNAGEHQALPEKLIYLLEHAYTSAELGFDALKGADSAVADVLLAATEAAHCDIHLALVSVEESGNAEYAGNGRYWQEDDFEEGEVFDRIETISEWRRPDGNSSYLPILPFSTYEFCPPDAFSEIEPDDVQFSEATGNEGASFERTYHCAALVVWPKSRYLAILNQAGLAAALPAMRDYCQRLDTEALLSWRDLVSWMEQTISKRADRAQQACAALLACLTLSKPDVARDLRGAAHALFMSLPGDPERFPLLQPWERAGMRATVELVVDVLTSFSSIDAVLAEDALNYMLAWPTVYAMDAVLAPAALQLTETVTSCDLVVVVHLRQAVRMHLHKRVAEALEAPVDWRRDSQTGCNCQDCAQFCLFLDNPSQSNWRFRAAEARRRHIEQAARHRDVDCATERTGSPHTLVCNKNQASYLRRVAQRKNDLDALARLAVEN